MHVLRLIMLFPILWAACSTSDQGGKEYVDKPPEKSADSLIELVKVIQAQGFSDSARSIIAEIYESDSAACVNSTERAVWLLWHQHILNDLADAALATSPAHAQAMSSAIANHGAAHGFHDARTLAAHDLLESRVADRSGDKIGSYQMARAAVERLAAANDTLNLTAARSLNLISKVVLDSGHVDRALQVMFRAARIAEAIDSTGDACGFINRRAGQLVGRDMALAMELYDSSQACALRGGDTIAYCTAINGKSIAYERAFDGGNAIVERSRAIALLNKLKTYPGDLLPNLCTNLASTAYERGLFVLGDSVLKIVDELESRGKVSTGARAFLRNARGVREGAIGNNLEFLAYAREARNLGDECGMINSSAANYLELLKALSVALHYNQLHAECVELVRAELGRPEFNAGNMADTRQWMRTHEALALMALGRHDEARLVLELLTESSNRWKALGNLGSCYQAMRNWDSADSCFTLQWQELPEADLDGPVYQAGILSGLADNANGRGEWQRARLLADSALVILNRVENPIKHGLPKRPADRMPAWKPKALALFEIAKLNGPDDPAFVECLRTDSLLRAACDRALVQMRDPYNRSVILSTANKSANRSIRLLRMLLQGQDRIERLEEILGLVDYSRDRQSKAMSATSSAAANWGLPEGLMKKERDLNGILAKQAALVTTMEGGRLKARLDREIIALTDSLRTVRSRIMQLAPGYYQELELPVAFDLPKVRMALGSDSSFLLVQHLDPVDSILLSIGVFRDTLLVAEATVSPLALSKLASDLRESGRSSSMGLDNELRALFAATVKPYLGAQSARTMLVVPDATFTSIPFEALVATPDSGSHSEKAYLGERLVVRYGSSIHQFLGERARERRNDLAYAGFAPRYPSNHSASRDAVRGSSDVVRGLQPLNENDDEVNAAKDALKGRAFIGTDASESNFNEAAPDAGLLHLAMHGVLDPLQPMNSMLVFAKPAPDDARDDSSARDGHLHFHELVGLRLQADLAVLSSCETGVGLYQSGEGVMSLGRAFNYAGVPNVVSSLWKVDDRATKEIMVKFYEKLAEGMGKADALAEAKRWYRKEYPNEPPSKWAAFILIGDNEPVRLKKRSPVQPWLIGGGLVAVIAAIAARRRRMRRAA